MNSKRSPFYGYRFPPEIIGHAVWLYHRFCLSFRDVEDLLAERGIEVSYESIRHWCARFGPEYARKLKKWRGSLCDTWYLYEVFIRIGGELHYLWRAVDQDGDCLDLLVQKRCNKKAASRFFRKLLKGQGTIPRLMITDKLKIYAAARRAMMPSVIHSTEQYENNRAELSHQPTRQRARQMRRFKSIGHAQRFLSTQGEVCDLFRLGRHLTRAVYYRAFRSKAFTEWQQFVCVW